MNVVLEHKLLLASRHGHGDVCSDGNRFHSMAGKQTGGRSEFDDNISVNMIPTERVIKGALAQGER